MQALEVYGDGVKPADMNENHFRRLFYPVAFSPFSLFLKERRLKDWSRESLQDLDCDTLAALFEAFYGMSFNKERDVDNVGYCENIIRLTQSPVFSEVARHMQKLLSQDMIDEKAQSNILAVITQPDNMFNLELCDELLNTLPMS